MDWQGSSLELGMQLVRQARQLEMDALDSEYFLGDTFGPMCELST